MTKTLNQIFIWGVMLAILYPNDVVANLRGKRLVTFTRSAPARIQLIMGLGVPVQLHIESVTVGYVFKAEYLLPENATNYLNFIREPFDLTTRRLSSKFVRKRRENGELIESTIMEESEPTPAPLPSTNSSDGFDSIANEKYERYEVSAIEIETKSDDEQLLPTPSDDGYHEDDENDEDDEDDENDDDSDEFGDQNGWEQPLYSAMSPKQSPDLSASRWNAYKSMAALAKISGFNGRACVLRSICECAHVPFDYSNGILGELVHILMTPSLTKDTINEHADNEYLRAEKLGKQGEPCGKIFKECDRSVLEQFSGIYTPLVDMMQMLG